VQNAGHMVHYADPAIISRAVEALAGRTEPERAPEGLFGRVSPVDR
jgi:hypothetical protein